MVIDRTERKDDGFFHYKDDAESEAETMDASLGSPDQSEKEYTKGIPSLLAPINSDWSPTDRDKRAPPVLVSRTMMGKLRTIVSCRPGKPFRPTPMSFLRRPPSASPSGPTYSSFEAFYLPGRHEKQIANGFEPRYPAGIMVDHDVSAVDWDRFLLNLRIAGALRGRDYLIANLLPAPLFLVHAGLGNYWIAKGILSGLQRRYIPKVLALVETYQYRFFQQRKLDVFVACGTSRMTGYFPGDDSYLDAPPVETGLRLNDWDSSSSSSSSSESSDSDEEEYLRRVPRKQRRQIKAARKNEQVASGNLCGIDAEYRARVNAGRKNSGKDKLKIRQRRREEMREEKQAGFTTKKHGKYRIVIQPMDKAVVQPSGEWLLQLKEREKRWGHGGGT